MKITLSVIKADIGSIGGHIRPSAKLLETVRAKVAELGKGLLIDAYVGPRISTTSRRCCATRSGSSSNPSAPAPPVRSRPWSAPRVSTTSRGNTPGRTTR